MYDQASPCVHLCSIKNIPTQLHPEPRDFSLIQTNMMNMPVSVIMVLIGVLIYAFLPSAGQRQCSQKIVSLMLEFLCKTVLTKPFNGYPTSQKSVSLLKPSTHRTTSDIYFRFPLLQSLFINRTLLLLCICHDSACLFPHTLSIFQNLVQVLVFQPT